MSWFIAPTTSAATTSSAASARFGIAVGCDIVSAERSRLAGLGIEFLDGKLDVSLFHFSDFLDVEFGIDWLVLLDVIDCPRCPLFGRLGGGEQFSQRLGSWWLGALGIRARGIAAAGFPATGLGAFRLRRDFF